MTQIPVGVLGASGYTGRELCKLVLAHPCLELAFAAANDQQGTVARVGGHQLVFTPASEAPLNQVALVFSALPHGVSGAWVQRANAAGARVVDLSSDLRPGRGVDATPLAKNLAEAPYGLTELCRAAISNAEVVANPGCYPTAALLALAPLIERDLIAPNASIIINAASGVTGAGNSPTRELLFAEVTEDFRAYGVGNSHRHVNEMRAAVDGWRGRADLDLVFTPHLLPVARGILASMVVPLRTALADPLAPWREAYAEEPFIVVSPDPPALSHVVHRNIVSISACMVVSRQPTLLVMSAIDNLLKGAAGQAMQNANLMLGLPEHLGLPS
jgi:N-acetyl-gamma-glutamyl-phosphate reductase